VRKIEAIDIALAGRNRSHAVGPHTDFGAIFTAEALIPAISCTIRPALDILQRNVA
jgi:hypothetical protein